MDEIKICESKTIVFKEGMHGHRTAPAKGIELTPLGGLVWKIGGIGGYRFVLETGWCPVGDKNPTSSWNCIS